MYRRKYLSEVMQLRKSAGNYLAATAFWLIQTECRWNNEHHCCPLGDDAKYLLKERKHLVDRSIVLTSLAKRRIAQHQIARYFP